MLIIIFGNRHRASSVIRAECSFFLDEFQPRRISPMAKRLAKIPGRTTPRKRTALADKSLYVGNLPYNTTEEDLKSLFEPWGPVSEARVIQGRGFGFVDLPEENVAQAIEATNGKEYQGRTITVNEARPKTEARGRGGFGGGGGGRGGFGGGRRERW